MPSILHVPITAYGERVSGIAVPIGSTVDFDIACQDASTRNAIDLSGANVVMSLAALDPRGNPVQPPLISRQATVTDAVNGKCTVPWTSGDTVPTLQTPFNPGVYGFDLWLTDVSGNRQQLLSYGTLDLTASAGLPGAPITPGPSQSPLALGPQGPKGNDGLPRVIKLSGSSMPVENAVNFSTDFTAADNSGSGSTDVGIATSIARTASTVQIAGTGTSLPSATSSNRSQVFITEQNGVSDAAYMSTKQSDGSYIWTPILLTISGVNSALANTTAAIAGSSPAFVSGGGLEFWPTAPDVIVESLRDGQQSSNKIVLQGQRWNGTASEAVTQEIFCRPVGNGASLIDPLVGAPWSQLVFGERETLNGSFIEYLSVFRSWLGTGAGTNYQTSWIMGPYEGLTLSAGNDAIFNIRSAPDNVFIWEIGAGFAIVGLDAAGFNPKHVTTGYPLDLGKAEFGAAECWRNVAAQTYGNQWTAFPGGVSNMTRIATFEAHGGGLAVKRLPAPSSPSLATIGATGSSSYSYYVVGKDVFGNKTLASSVVTISTAAASLSSSAAVSITATLQDSVWSYDVIRSAGGTSQGLIGTISMSPADTSSTGTAFDEGQAATPYTLPVRNGTGDSLFDGNVLSETIQIGADISIRPTASSSARGMFFVSEGSTGVADAAYICTKDSSDSYNWQPFGTVTSVSTGTGLSGGPVISTGTISLANTTVTAGSYGDSSHVPSVTVDAQGRLTAASNTSIQISESQVTGLVSDLASKGSGTVTSITAGTGLSGGVITGTGTIAIDSTVTTLTGTQTLTNKTLTGPIITGLTASGSSSNDFSGSTGQFVTSSGGNTLSGNTILSANKSLTCNAGTGLFDFSSATGLFSTSSGTNTLNGNTVLASNKSFTVTSGTGSLDFSAATGIFHTSSGTNNLNGSVTLAANKSFTAASGTGGFDFSAASGTFKTSTGTTTISGTAVSLQANTTITTAAALTNTTGTQFSDGTADGSSSVSFSWVANNIAQTDNGTNRIASFRTGAGSGTERVGFNGFGEMFFNTTGGYTRLFVNSTEIMTLFPGNYIACDADLISAPAQVRSLGQLGGNWWNNAWLRSYFALSQAPGFSSTISIDPSLGEVVTVTLTANLASWSVVAPKGSGARMILTFTQDATGSRTIGTPPSNIKWAGGSAPTLSTGANKNDTFTFMSIDTTNWIEVGQRNMNWS